MPKFFVPDHTAKRAEELYAYLQKHGASVSGLRLFKLRFRDRSRTATAEVGEGIEWSREDTGPVLAIIETSTVINVFTRLRIRVPIMVGPEEVIERVYFDP